MTSAPRSDATRWALWAALAAALGVLSAWGFSVDDALISARVAQHLALGHGYRFNLDGPSTDCVTPLGWAQLLAPFARGGSERAVLCAALGGAALWLAAAAQLGRLCAARCSGPRRAAFVLCLAVNLPLAAWASAGMETGLVLALGVGALTPGWRGALCAGLAAALRPELAPWAAALSFGQALASAASLRARAGALLLALAPALCVALIRLLAFGRAAPLAVFAKPSDFEHGVRYAFGALLLAGPALSWLSFAPWRQVSAQARAIAVAFGVHVLVLVGIGGDWMPFWRLAVPAFPGVLLVGAELAERASHWSNALRGLLLVGAAALVHGWLGGDARGVRARQALVIAAGRELLAGAERIASVDVGWLGAATDRHIVDLAGVTDPEVAFLPGGHTSKRLPNDFLERQRVDALVLRRRPLPAAVAAGDPRAGESSLEQLRAADAARWAYAVDARVLTLRGAERFETVGTIPLAAGDYVVLRAKQAAPP